MKKLSLQEVLEGIEDTRRERCVWYPLHVVSVFSAKCGLVLGQLACEEKSNEITAIPKLLEMLEIKGCIVTIDAMGTQYEIAQKITDKGADYILALMEPERKLWTSSPALLRSMQKRSDSFSDWTNRSSL